MEPPRSIFRTAGVNEPGPDACVFGHMEHLTSTVAETRVNPPSVEEVASTETANCLVANDEVDVCAQNVA